MIDKALLLYFNADGTKKLKGGFMRVTNFSSVVLTMLALLSIGNCPPAYAQKSATEIKVGCLKKNQLNKTLTPVDLYQSVAACIDEGNYEQSFFLFGLAGASGRYDSYRVNDNTAHQAIQILRINAFQSVSEEKRTGFQAYAEKFGNDRQKVSGLCTELKRLQAPSYSPQYMIHHGMKFMATASDAGILVALPDPKTSWKKAVDDYLKCSDK